MSKMGIVGLSDEQVRQRVEAGDVNTASQGLTPTVSRIILKNTFTLFNIIYVALAILNVAVGHPEQILFLWIIICNTGMGIIQELRAKRTLDKLSLLAKSKARVLRNDTVKIIPQEQVVIDDIVVLAAGDQICADGIVLTSERLETDEALLTGEPDRIRKEEGDTVLSGSYVASGKAFARITAVGERSYANSITAEAKKSSKRIPKLLRVLNRIILVMTIIIIPLGTALFYVNYFIGGDTIQSAVLGSSASMLGMIPAGLIVLTSVTMTVSALKLARRKALVQALPSIETLARTDVLCLDKTGTITDGTLVFERFEISDEITEETGGLIISELMGALSDNNATAAALTGVFGATENWLAKIKVPFSSDRKWSGATFAGKGSFIIGAPNIIFAGRNVGFLDIVNEEASKGFRVLCLAYSDYPIEDDRLPEGLRCLALLIFSDNIRANAVETFSYFAREGVKIKVISGDNPRTVSAVAVKAGIDGAENAVDMSGVGSDPDYAAIVSEYTVFGHVTPYQKRELIRGLKKNGHTACMTGDGVNDILAMRESDCSVSMVSGSDAARSACDFVLVSDDFSIMVDVLREGRRVINNIEKVASIFLWTSLFSAMLTLIYIILPYSYPLTPLHMWPINTMTVGIPAFFISLQNNYARPEGRMVSTFLTFTLPAAITVVFNTMYLQLASILFEIPFGEFATMVVLLMGFVGFCLLFRLTKPYTWRIKLMLGCMIGGFVFIYGVLGYFSYIDLTVLINRNAFFYLPLIYFSYYINGFLGRVCVKTLRGYYVLKSSDSL